MVKLASIIGILLLLQGFARADGPATQPAARTTSSTTPSTQPATQPALVSKPVEKDGLSAIVTLPQARFAHDESLSFSVTFRNTSNKDLRLSDPRYFLSWRIRFTDLRTQDSWLPLPLFEDKRARVQMTLEPGRTLEVPVLLDTTNRNLVFVPNVKGPVTHQVKHLPPGRYRLTIDIILAEPPLQQNGFWTGKLTTEPVEFTVADPPSELFLPAN